MAGKKAQGPNVMDFLRECQGRKNFAEREEGKGLRGILITSWPEVMFKE